MNTPRRARSCSEEMRLRAMLKETASAPPNKRLLRGRHTEWSDRRRIPLPTPNPNPGDTSMMMITRASKATSTVVRAAPRVVFVIFVVTVASLITIRTTASPLAAGCEPGRPSPRPPAEHPGVPCRRLSETLSGRRGLRQALNNPECSFDSGDCDGIPWDTDSSNIASKPPRTFASAFATMFLNESWSANWL